MTKEEIKALINAKLAGQGNQVDLGSVLPTILNEIVDMAGSEEPIIIDLSGYELSGEEIVVSDAIPQNYKPNQNDKILYDGKILYFNCGIDSAQDYNSYSFGYRDFNDNLSIIVELTYNYDDGEYYAVYYEQ